MTKATDELGLVEGVRRDLHSAHEGHALEEGEELGGGGLDKARGWLDLVPREGDGGLDGQGGRLVGGEGSEEESTAAVGGEAAGSHHFDDEGGSDHETTTKPEMHDNTGKWVLYFYSTGHLPLLIFAGNVSEQAAFWLDKYLGTPFLAYHYLAASPLIIFC